MAESTFDLESALRDWRRDMSAALGDRPEILDELESHLREEMTRATLGGQPAAAAWAAAIARLGPPAELAAEFAKMSSAAPWRWLPAWIAVGFYVMTTLTAAIAMSPRMLEREWGVLLAPHVTLVLAGYLATMTLGALSAGLTLSRLWGGVTRRRLESLRWWGLRFAIVGTALCLAGVAFGSLWGRMALGSYWTNDPREFGGIAMIAFNVFAMAWLARPHSLQTRRVDLALGLVGNIVVGLSWFVANHAAHHSLSELPLVWSIFLACYFGGNAALFIAACLPMATPRSA